MGKIRHNIKNRTYYFYNDQINLKVFHASMLKIDKKKLQRGLRLLHWLCDLCEIANCNNINSVNPLYLKIDKMIDHFKEKNGNKYLVLDDIDENKEVSTKYEEFWDGIKKEIETINGGKKIEYEKDFKKIRFESNDDLSMNKPI